MPPAARARAVEEVALALAIPELLGRTVDTLSGGELQRVALAAALVTRPALVLLDEPTSQLDPVAGDELIWLLRRLNEEWGVTIVLAEHRLERCLAAADRVVAMDAGTIAFDGDPRGFLAWAQGCRPRARDAGARMFSLGGHHAAPDRRPRRPRTSPPRGRSGRASPRNSGAVEESRPSAVSRAGPARPRAQETCGSSSGTRRRGATSCKGVDLRVERGERVALMGRNGAGKSTLLRTVAGLEKAVRGRVEAPEGVALLTQSPGDFLVRERVGDELPGEEGLEALRVVGLEDAVDADPRDLSGGERQRLALAIVLAGGISGGSLPGAGRARRADQGHGPGPQGRPRAT